MFSEEHDLDREPTEAEILHAYRSAMIVGAFLFAFWISILVEAACDGLGIHLRGALNHLLPG